MSRLFKLTISKQIYTNHFRRFAEFSSKNTVKAMLALELNPKKKPTALEIKSSYKKLALKYHPDSIQNKSESETKDLSHKFSEITEAYDYLIEQHTYNFVDHIFEDEIKDPSLNSQTDDRVKLNQEKDPIAYKRKREEYIQKLKFNKFMSVALKQNELRMKEAQAKAAAEEEEKKRNSQQQQENLKDSNKPQGNVIISSFKKLYTALNERETHKEFQRKIKEINKNNFEKLTQKPISPYKVVIESADDPQKFEVTEFFKNSHMNAEQEEVYKALKSKKDYDNFYAKLNK